MELLNGLNIESMGFVMLVTFGAVAAINFWKPQAAKTNFLMSVGFAIGFSFVPADMGSAIANRIKDAVAVAIALNGAYQALGGIAKKIGQ